MAGGRFLVGLREVEQTQRILACDSLLKGGINFWEEDLEVENDFDEENAGEIFADAGPQQMSLGDY